MSVILHGDIPSLSIQVGHEVTISLHALLEIECRIALCVSIRIRSMLLDKAIRLSEISCSH